MERTQYTHEQEELLQEFREKAAEAGLGQYLYDSTDELLGADVRRGILMEEGVYRETSISINFEARACGKRVFGTLASWSMDELVNSSQMTTDKIVQWSLDLFSRTDEEMNEDILHDEANVFEPWDCTGTEWQALVRQELASREGNLTHKLTEEEICSGRGLIADLHDRTMLLQLQEFRKQITKAGFGQYLRGSFDEAFNSVDRKSIVVNDEGVTLMFEAEAWGELVLGSFMHWTTEEIMKDENAFGAAIKVARALSAVPDEELNEAILHDNLLLNCMVHLSFTPYEYNEAEWHKLVRRELDTRVNSVEELKELWDTTPLYAEWTDASDSLLQENGYALEEAVGYMKDGIRIYRDDLDEDQEEDMER